jgi:hypothetical protein
VPVVPLVVMRRSSWVWTPGTTQLVGGERRQACELVRAPGHATGPARGAHPFGVERHGGRVLRDRHESPPLLLAQAVSRQAHQPMERAELRQAGLSRMLRQQARRALKRGNRVRAHRDALPSPRWGRQRRLRYRDGVHGDIMPHMCGFAGVS